MAYLGKCYICGDDNTHRLPVYIGRVRLICKRHGASTTALYDAMTPDLERRVRIYKHKDGFTISRMNRIPIGGYRTYGGRREYKKWETVLREAKKFID